MKNKKFFFGVFLVLLVLVLGGVLFYSVEESAPTGEVIDESISEEVFPYVDISSMEAKELIDNNPSLIIIDVSPKYDEGHISNSVNYYVGDGSLDRAISYLDKDAMYLVYCHFESASRLGAQKLVDAGFPNVYRLEDNYAGWVDSGYPVEY